jgi:hypothetical protein
MGYIDQREEFFRFTEYIQQRMNVTTNDPLGEEERASAIGCKVE